MVPSIPLSQLLIRASRWFDRCPPERELSSKNGLTLETWIFIFSDNCTMSGHIRPGLMRNRLRCVLLHWRTLVLNLDQAHFHGKGLGEGKTVGLFPGYIFLLDPASRPVCDAHSSELQRGLESTDKDERGGRMKILNIRHNSLKSSWRRWGKWQNDVMMIHPQGRPRQSKSPPAGGRTATF